MRITVLAAATGAAALLTLTAGCSNDTEPTAPSSTLQTPSSISPSSVQREAPVQTKTVTVPPPAPTVPEKPGQPAQPGNPTGPGNEYDVPCTGGPDEGTICTNPNHGAGDDPHGTGAPHSTTTKPR
ncbi:Lipoprotein OS=Tsukamurella paurometabola (strain ATCC 8368 / DSM / CCUG 35730 / CIP 100753/ JCM 10117 / KCTC 9821 / NBRC 16120 / NCIMB 702349 / NCTC 13040)OX=521096 GN=Tpau_0806 PE=4 SV=1 [Tsukamurella paurometabola]|uniref:Lipoprotein n=1 Tax=Tsukamurella paurometabola (strain ATCC 8368 / DSM 20162 / CCUG 35730 / CIP 100753 / JCM 10117 / KCTC 9821 / NBRC 16120 / NCIMB 702349 / NCTC 13040) TaxID=521096 RepID=D5UTT8_TSUPD|nr:hypothetical protein [Tsukamurella paurometabola]ADG77442.1 hypothetical protein Tpau_0806 [Tsukamurella paurometabola DSM 20162]SUP27062.1 Uncharacterised protein [Tsukamurella paurometabola]